MYSVLGFSPYEQDNFKSFYDYIKEHADERKQIEDFLKKIHKLGIEYVELDEGVDFTQCVYRLDERSIIDRKDDDVYYLQNMVGIPSVDGKFIYYKTLGSNYEIHSLVNKLLCESGLHGECITVKRLGIDPKSLPEIYSPVSIRCGEISIVKSVPFAKPKIIKNENIFFSPSPLL